jgi:hypothetical protein
MLGRLLQDEGGAVGPVGAYIYGVLLVLLTIGITAGIAAVGGAVRDQAAYASVLAGAASAAARDVSVRALAGGQGVIDGAHAQATFSGFLTAPNEGALTPTGQGTYAPAGAGEGAVDAGTVRTLSVGSLGVSGSHAAVKGSVEDDIPAPFIRGIRGTLPEAVTVVTTPALGSIGEP